MTELFSFNIHYIIIRAMEFDRIKLVSVQQYIFYLKILSIYLVLTG